MDIKHVRIDTFTNNSKVTEMRLTDEKTGITIKGEGSSRFLLKKELLVLF